MFKLLSFCFVLIFSSCLTPSQKLIKNTGFKKGIFAKITTEKGTMIAKLEYKKAPLTVANFIGLSQGIIPNEVKKEGEPYYDGQIFYRVIKGNIAIGGCPKGNGTGHPGYVFRDEFHKDLKHNKPGILSMVSHGPNSNGSQFIITMTESPAMDGINSVFGLIISGIDILSLIQQGEKIVSIEIIKLGKDANRFDPLEIFKKNGFNTMLNK